MEKYMLKFSVKNLLLKKEFKIDYKTLDKTIESNNENCQIETVYFYSEISRDLQ